jgi:hypothetical protein
MDKKDYFGKEDEFLKSIYDKEGKLLSKNRIQGTLNLTPELLLEKNYKIEYCDMLTYENGFFYTDTIFRNKSDIFIYLSKKETNEVGYQTMIYFDPERLEEIKFFIKNLIKLK